MAYKLISQLHHVELFTGKPEESVAFYKDVLGMQESARDGNSVYLRAWGEFFHHSLKVTEGPMAGLGHAAWRVDGPDDVDVAAKALEKAGVEGRFIDGDVGHGRAYQFWTPGGHLAELVWESERYVAPPELKSTFPNRPQRQVEHGAPVRRIDHLTTASTQLMADVELFRDVLGFRFMEATQAGPQNSVIFATLTSGPQNHDFAIINERPGDPSVKPGRMNHLCYYYDTREDLLRALDILSEHGFKLEAGPLKHGIGELFFAYVVEPGGTIIELQTGGYWNFMPDWETVYWPNGGVAGANTAWHTNQFGVFGMSPLPGDLERLPESAAPTQQYTAKEREAQLVS